MERSAGRHRTLTGGVSISAMQQSVPPPEFMLMHTFIGTVMAAADHHAVAALGQALEGGKLVGPAPIVGPGRRGVQDSLGHLQSRRRGGVVWKGGGMR